MYDKFGLCVLEVVFKQRIIEYVLRNMFLPVSGNEIFKMKYSNEKYLHLI